MSNIPNLFVRKAVQSSNISNQTTTNSLPEPFQSILLEMYLFVIAFVLFGNAFIVIAFAYYSSLRTISNCFVVTLAVADLTVTVFVGFTVASQLAYKFKIDAVWCVISSTVSSLGIMSSCVFTLVICLHRFIRLTQSNTIYKNVFEGRCKLALWCSAPTLVSLPLSFDLKPKYYWQISSCHHDLYHHIAQTIIYFHVLFIVIPMYYFTYKRVMAKRLASVNCSEQKRQLMEEKSSILKYSLIFSSLNMILYCPKMLLMLYALSVDGETSMTVTLCLALSEWLLLLCGSANSIVYGAMNTGFRNHMIQILTCGKHEAPVEEELVGDISPDLDSIISVKLNELGKRTSSTRNFDAEGVWQEQSLFGSFVSGVSFLMVSKTDLREPPERDASYLDGRTLSPGQSTPKRSRLNLAFSNMFLFKSSPTAKVSRALQPSERETPSYDGRTVSPNQKTPKLSRVTLPFHNLLSSKSPSTSRMTLESPDQRKRSGEESAESSRRKIYGIFDPLHKKFINRSLETEIKPAPNLPATSKSMSHERSSDSGPELTETTFNVWSGDSRSTLPDAEVISVKDLIIAHAFKRLSDNTPIETKQTPKSKPKTRIDKQTKIRIKKHKSKKKRKLAIVTFYQDHRTK